MVAVFTDDDIEEDDLDEALRGSSVEEPVVILVDDADMLTDADAADTFSSVVRRGAERGRALVLAGDEEEIAGGFSGWQVEAKPRETNLTVKVVSISSRVEINAAERTLVYKRRFDISQRQVAAAQEYENVRTLFGEVEKNDAQKLVLVRR